MSQFAYSAHISGLKLFYDSMKKYPVTIGNFEHTYNKVTSTVVFDTSDNSKGWKIIFMKKGTGEILTLPVAVGYKLEIKGNDLYAKFINYFNISGEKGKFRISEFSKNFDSQIPSEYIISEKTRDAILNYKSDGEGKYPIGVKNWQIYHALHPEVSSDKYHRSPENLLKTQNFYPDIYNATKDMDLTIIYGKTPGKYTDAIKNCTHDWKIDLDS